MNEKYLIPFIEGLEGTLSQFGVGGFERGAFEIKESMVVKKDITTIIGLVGDIRGNIAFSFAEDTAKKICSAMMMGMPVNEIDEMAQSALRELSNMIVGQSLLKIESEGLNNDITPPSLIFGKDILFTISQVESKSIEVKTSLGDIEINMGLELSI